MVYSMGAIPFTDNYTDLSSNRGFQFKFHCRKCGNGYMSTFESNKLGVAASAAEAVSGLLGGLFGQAAHTAQSLGQIVAGPQHDAALRKAVEEIRPLFRQCSRCGGWVCEPVCWNMKAGLCESCAPDLDEEISSAQAQAAKSQVEQKVQSIDYIGDRDLTQQGAISCPKCGARTRGGKYCPECGAAIAQKKNCASCGALADGSPKFCPECGKPFGG
ncbi:MAG: zinc ribbon domain-containing protein [Gammaproteobacteria bacterium]